MEDVVQEVICFLAYLDVPHDQRILIIKSMVIEQRYLWLIAVLPHHWSLRPFLFKFSSSRFYSIPEWILHLLVVLERVKLLLCLFRCYFSLPLLLLPHQFCLWLRGFESIWIKLWIITSSRWELPTVIHSLIILSLVLHDGRHEMLRSLLIVKCILRRVFLVVYVLVLIYF